LAVFVKGIGVTPTPLTNTANGVPDWGRESDGIRKVKGRRKILFFVRHQISKNATTANF